jgi:hypothetical protein
MFAPSKFRLALSKHGQHSDGLSIYLTFECALLRRPPRV